MRHRRRLVALAAVLAALGATPAAAAAGPAAGHPGTPVHAGPLARSAPTRLGAAAGHGAPRMERAASGDDRGPGRGGGGDRGPGRGGGGDRGPGRGGADTRDAAATDPFVVVASATAGAGALVALVLSVSRALRRRRG
ncbi:hypothetical protein [Streptomyces sp. NBC_00358]|uniref:hypothetical protein n=1 Tax=Streptomyces sp. NBC_00358 TaxID=2975725 RepID=UPI002E262AE4